MHNRKLLALAVAGTLGAPIAAYADTANVNVYGKLYPQYQTQSAHGASKAGETVSTLVGNGTGILPASSGDNGIDGVSLHRIESTNSYIGFKGEADAGGGMKGWFQIEQRLRLENGNGSWSSRNSAAGISGAFGNVFLGNWDTVYKQLGDPVSFLGVSSGNFFSTSNIISRLWTGADAADFHRRAQNNIEYDSPNLGGVQLMVNYSPDEGKTYAKSAWLGGAGVKWEAGPLYVAVMREIHNDNFGGSATTTVASQQNTASANNGPHSKDTATRVSAKFTFGGTELGVDVAELYYREYNLAGSGKFEEYKHKTFSFVASQKLGALQLAGSLSKADKGKCKLSGGVSCTTDGLDAMQIALGAKFDFSKRVGVFGVVNKVTNGKSASYNGQPGGTTANAGSDPETAAVGLIVSF